MLPPYVALIEEIIGKADQYVQTSPPVSYAKPTKREVAALEHLDWVPGSIWDFCQVANGLLLEWKANPSSTSQCTGRINIQRIQNICHNWEGVVYFEGQASADNPRLRNFHVVDLVSDEEGVGFYYDECKNPELYLCGFSDYLPEPLGIDFNGYIQLLRLSLGHQYWPHLVAELQQYFSAGAIRPFVAAEDPNAQIFVQDMTALLPDFSLRSFVLLYDQMRLVP